jgi:hypothetical protein
MLLVTFGSLLSACGESDVGEPFSQKLVYCDNADVAAPSCSLAGYSMADDSALRAKLEGCAVGACHGDPVPATIWKMDLSGSVQFGLAPLATIFGVDGLYYLVDESDPDCSKLLTELTAEPVGGLRMPLASPPWSNAEVDCFRSYLHEMSN